jgi:hypothetical protein
MTKVVSSSFDGMGHLNEHVQIPSVSISNSKPDISNIAISQTFESLQVCIQKVNPANHMTCNVQNNAHHISFSSEWTSIHILLRLHQNLLMK